MTNSLWSHRRRVSGKILVVLPVILFAHRTGYNLWIWVYGRTRFFSSFRKQTTPFRQYLRKYPHPQGGPHICERIKLLLLLRNSKSRSTASLIRFPIQLDPKSAPRCPYLYSSANGPLSGNDFLQISPEGLTSLPKKSGFFFHERTIQKPETLKADLDIYSKRIQRIQFPPSR